MLSTLLVFDEIPAELASLNAISFNDYLEDHPKLKEPKIRVINLCNTDRYLSQGYYCSLLAEARQHQVIPTVKMINALRGDNLRLVVPDNLLPKQAFTDSDGHETLLCLGTAMDARFQKVGDWVYQQFMAPLLRLSLRKYDLGVELSIDRASLSELNDEAHTFCLDHLQAHSNQSWNPKSARQKHRWDLAILTDHHETVPPSNKGAIKRFIKAAGKLGIRATEISAQDYGSLTQYDALFIRETTAIDHHTYRFACEAEKNGLIVMDDPNSILRCCNKVFLHDAFSYQKVPSPKTLILTDNKSSTLDMIEDALTYPVILKVPESAFSKGVFKIKNRAELEDYTREILTDSALFIAQEYMFTEYDWRIGVLNGRALYACRYYMAKNHWQIYNHKSKRNFSGGFDALPTFEVPTHVLQAALKAASVVGNSLYGIDVKEVNGKAYVLEVNDNPSLEHGIEDKYLGEELYMQIMSEFLRRLEARGRR